MSSFCWHVTCSSSTSCHITSEHANTTKPVPKHHSVGLQGLHLPPLMTTGDGLTMAIPYCHSQGSVEHQSWPSIQLSSHFEEGARRPDGCSTSQQFSSWLNCQNEYNLHIIFIPWMHQQECRAADVAFLEADVSAGATPIVRLPLAVTDGKGPGGLSSQKQAPR